MTTHLRRGVGAPGGTPPEGSAPPGVHLRGVGADGGTPAEVVPPWRTATLPLAPTAGFCVDL